MTLPRFTIEFWADSKRCRVCDHVVLVVDCDTALCVDCWRAVVLAPAAVWMGEHQWRDPDVKKE